jgi:ATP adenylyltransferase
VLTLRRAHEIGPLPTEAGATPPSLLTFRCSRCHEVETTANETLFEKGGFASLRDIAACFLAQDESQIEYYIEITKRMPGPVLTRHQLVRRDGAGYRLVPDVQALTSDERNALLRLCDEAVANYTGRRLRKLYDHRRLALGDISGTVRYEVLKRAGFRCELCGISADERFLDVDHIMPRRHVARTTSQTFRQSAPSATPTKAPATTPISVLFVKA